GKVLVIAGSAGMCGAAHFAAKAAYRTGAGLVYILTPEQNRGVLQTLIPEAIVIGYHPDRFDEEKLAELVR
ncbi:MAG: bifunctional ADP-dependent NAD(P)H-hydrate dehydratase/NAD(P)H-hydrate epimerase, partial [Lachnospiraceae bacterium]|nr:bifunctional ADP-dependent NAD(P)H-hydrate dehydratase/NAD(P)H-hydrate epimerase [Lachnospiraceae bacterium]